MIQLNFFEGGLEGKFFILTSNHTLTYNFSSTYFEIHT